MPEMPGGPTSTTSDTPDGAAAGSATPATHLTGSAERTVLLAALVETVLAVPGVVRLEPTLSTTGPGLLLRRAPTDGIRLLTSAGAVHVDINVATHADHQARTVAHQIQSATKSVLLTCGHSASSVTVSVLDIEHTPV